MLVFTIAVAQAPDSNTNEGSDRRGKKQRQRFEDNI